MIGVPHDRMGKRVYARIVFLISHIASVVPRARGAERRVVESSRVRSR